MPRSRSFACVLCVTLGTALALALLLVAPRPAAAAEPPAPPKGPVSFINDVAPILKENCFACHDAKKRKGKLDMTTLRELPQGRHQGRPHRTPASPTRAYILDLLTGNGRRRMPPKDTGDALPQGEDRHHRSSGSRKGPSSTPASTTKADLHARAARPLEAAAAAGRLHRARSRSPRWPSRPTARSSSSAATTS